LHCNDRLTRKETDELLAGANLIASWLEGYEMTGLHHHKVSTFLLALSFCLLNSYIFISHAHALLAEVPETGQTTGYAAGDDGTLKPGVSWPAPRFANNGNGTVTDKLSGLIWLKNANCTESVGGISKSNGYLTWASALTWSYSLVSGKCGLSDGSAAGDWRLPNRNELESLVDASRVSPALPVSHPFNLVQSFGYWSSSTNAGYTADAWVVYMFSGNVDIYGKSFSYYVWPVRGGQFGDPVISVSPPSRDFSAGSPHDSQIVTCSNTSAGGSDRLQVNAMVLSGTDADQFSVNYGDGSSGSCGSLTPIIASGSSCSVVVNFTPTSSGAKSAALRVSGSDVNTPNVDVTLAAVAHTVTASVSGGNGSISSAATVYTGDGTSASFTLAPTTTYQPASSVSGSCPAGSWNGNQYTTGPITADCTVDFSFAKITYPLTINFSGSGWDRVTVVPNPPAIDCIASCSQTFEIGTGVTLTASAAAGFSFTGWTGACTDSNGTCQITMDAAKSVTAAFADITPPLVSISSPTAALTSNRTPQLVYSVSDGTVVVTLDNNVININNNDNLPSLVDGSHTVVLEAVDTAANMGSASVTFEVDATAPVISISAPADDSFINTGRVGFSLNEAVAAGSITFTRTGGAADPLSPRSYPFISPDLTAGSHLIDSVLLQNGTVYTIAITAIDLAGNSALPVSITNVTFDADAAAVSIAAPLPAAKINNATVTYTLSEALASASAVFVRTAGSADPSSHIRPLTGAELTVGEHTILTGFSLVDGAVYSVVISNITDLAGNATTAASVTGITYDITALPTALNLPTAGSFITTSQAGYTLGEIAQSATITFTNTGGVSDGGSPWVYPISGADLENGSHTVITGFALLPGAIYTISLSAMDMAGNLATTVSVPNVTFTDRFMLIVQKSGSGNGMVSAPAGTGSGISCGSQCSETYMTDTTVTLTAEPDENSIFAGWSGACTNTAGPCQVTMDTIRGVTANFADISPPDASITSHPESPSTSTAFSFTFVATEAGSIFECSMNGGAWNVCTSPYNDSIVYAVCSTCRADIQMSFAVRAKDQAGNNDPTPASYGWTIDHPLNTLIGNVLAGGVVQLQGTDYTADLNVVRAISFTLRGGYSADYQAQSGVTGIHGTITITAGSVTFDNISIF